MKAWTVTGNPEMSGFELIDAPSADLNPGEVRVQLKAASINFRDTLVAAGLYPSPLRDKVIPLSDGCWEVLEIADDVTRVKPGDRVINCFASGWIEGPLEPWMWGTGFGAEFDGTLTQQRTLPAEVLVHVPDSFSDNEAATLPCAGVTAWSALFEGPTPLKPGQSVLTIGTGGVSVFAIQIGRASGARIISLSSSDEKLERARSIGADVCINYKTTPDWENEVRKATNDEGVDVVVEVGGPGTLAKSLAAVRHGGRVALIGALSDPTTTIHPSLVLMAHAHLHGVMVGSRRHTESLVRTVAVNKIKPAIDRVYDFDDAVSAFHDIRTGKHFGKLVISGS